KRIGFENALVKIIPKTSGHDLCIQSIVGKTLNTGSICWSATTGKMIIRTSVHHSDHVFKTAGIFTKYIIYANQGAKSLRLIFVITRRKKLAFWLNVHKIFAAGSHR